MKYRPEHDYSDAVCQPFLMQDGTCGEKKHGVLLLHGFTGNAAHMRPLGELLHAQGFTVMGINLPGHASSMDEMAQKTWEDWLNAAKTAFMELRAQCDYVSVAGLSMGGCLALIIAEQMQPTAVAAISAPMGTKAPLWLARVAAPFMKTVWWRSREESSSGTKPDPRYDRGYPGFRTKCGVHLAKLMRMSRQDLHAVTCPLLVVQSRADETITPDSAEIILKGASSRRKAVLWLEDAPHVCTISKDTDRIAAALAQHFRGAAESEIE